jgi:hypothetical protein
VNFEGDQCFADVKFEWVRMNCECQAQVNKLPIPNLLTFGSIALISLINNKFVSCSPVLHFSYIIFVFWDNQFQYIIMLKIYAAVASASGRERYCTNDYSWIKPTLQFYWYFMCNRMMSAKNEVYIIIDIFNLTPRKKNVS